MTSITGMAKPTDFKALYRKLEHALGQFERIDDGTGLLENVIRTLVRDFREELGFEMGRLYRRDGQDFYLCCTAGGSRPVALGFKVPRGYPPHLKTLEEGLLIMRKGDPGYDDQLEWAMGVTSTFAAIAVGAEPSHILAFTVDGEIREEQILYSLSAVRHVINLKLEERKLAGIMEEARIIQESLLPGAPPDCAGYDIHGYSRPAEIVGGDIYDYLPLHDCTIGIMIADSSGHGLPAALLARDVITGIRMGSDNSRNVARTVERLNRVIHQAALSSKFISLFYGIFEYDGRVTYCNAGHNPPLHLCGRRFYQLRRGGLVLGPDASATYEQGRIRMSPGDTVLLYTDGFVDQENTREKQFGIMRLRRLIRSLEGLNARESVEAIFNEADQFAAGSMQIDDMTAVVVKRL